MEQPTPTTGQSHALIERLRRLRGQLRSLLIAVGVGWLVALLVGGALLAILADFLLVLPAAFRAVLLVALIVGAIAVVYRRLILPMQYTLDEDELAVHLEGKMPALADRLATAVSFMRQPPPDSPRLVEETIRRADEELREVRFEEAVDVQPATKAGLAAIGAVTIALLLFAASPNLAGIGIERFVNPMTSTEWPKWVIIEPISVGGDIKVPKGENLEVSARLSKGDADNRRVFVVRQDVVSGRIERSLMTRGADGVYRYRLEDLTDNAQIWFETDGDDTRATAQSVTVVRRPVVTTASIRVLPPPYAQPADATIAELNATTATGRSQSNRFTTGSEVTLQFRVSKPVQLTNAETFLEVQASESEAVSRMVLSGLDGSSSGLASAVQASFTLTEPMVVTPRVIGEDGFANTSLISYRITPMPDEAPSVIVSEPPPTVQCTPVARVDVIGTAKDDFAITALSLDWQLQNSDEASNRGTIDLAPSSTLAAGGETTSEVQFRYPWELGDVLVTPDGTADAETNEAGLVPLYPGDVIVFTVKAADNYRATDGPQPVGVESQNSGPQIGASGEYRIVIISEKEFMDSVRRDLRAIKAQTNDVMTDQRQLQSDTQQRQRELDRGRELSEADKADVEEMASRQSRMVGRTDNLGEKVQTLVDRMRQNKIEDEEAVASLERIAQRFESTAREPMAGSSRSLQQSAQAEDIEPQKQAMNDADAQQTDALAGLQQIQNELEQWSDFADIKSSIRELLDKQNRIAEATEDLKPKLLGKNPEQLNEQERSELNRQAAEQNQLESETSALLNRMREAAANEQIEPGQKSALERASRAAEQNAVPQAMQQAGEQMQQNQMGSAQDNQAQAQQGLEEMIEELEKPDDRQLDQLARDIAAAKEALEDLLKRQQELIEQNEESQAKENSAEREADFQAQAQREQDLRRQARRVAQQIGDLAQQPSPGQQQAQESSDSTRDASSEMASAASKLQGNEGEQAQENQEAAQERLQEALRKLEEMEQAIQEEQQRQEQIKVRDLLVELRDAQQAIADETSSIDRRRERLGRLLAKDEQSLRELRDQQVDFNDRLGEVRGEVREVVTFDFALQRVSKDGLKLLRLFRNQETGNANQQTQERMIRRIQLLIDVLDEEINNPDSFEQQQQGGGGGGGQGQEPPLVPPLKELILVRELMDGVFKGTVETDGKFPQEERDDEFFIDEVQRVAEEQREVADIVQELQRQLQQQQPGQ